MGVPGANNVYTLHSLQSALYLPSNQDSRSESGWEPHEAERSLLSHAYSHAFPRAHNCKAQSLANSSPRPRSVRQADLLPSGYLLKQGLHMARSWRALRLQWELTRPEM